MISQNDQVLWYMREYGSITPKEATDGFGIMRLGARIWELKEEGFNIKREMIAVKNRFGRECRVARYSIIEKGVSQVMQEVEDDIKQGLLIKKNYSQTTGYKKE